MRSLKYYSLLIFLFILVASTAALAQDARLNFEKLDGLETRARDVVEVNIDGKLLDLAKRVSAKTNDENAKKVAQAISGLKGIYVRLYRFENENEYNIADINALRSQLNAPGWEKLANVRSKKNNQLVDVYTMFSGDVMGGVAVIISESKSIALVNVIGPIDIELLAELSGKLNIPKIDIEQEKDTTPKPNH
ncbi:MAG: DUF4252 domain-containing protein [Pyrinomonadaceae bacterium]